MIIFSKQNVSGLFYIVGLYLAHSNWFFASIISITAATLLLKLKMPAGGKAAG